MSDPEIQSAEIVPPKRRVLIAVVDGEAGDLIGAWRQRHDPRQAARLPPHLTLCYQVPPVEPALLEQQTRHAFPRSISVQLGGVRQFENRERTLYVDVHDTETLDAARETLYDGTHLVLPRPFAWPWHITCIRDSRARDLDALWLAARDLEPRLPWTIRAIAYLQLGADGYRPLAEWRVGESHPPLGQER